MGRPDYRISYDQRLYVCRQPSDGPRLPVEPATTDDVLDLVPMHARFGDAWQRHGEGGGCAFRAALLAAVRAPRDGVGAAGHRGRVGRVDG